MAIALFPLFMTLTPVTCSSPTVNVYTDLKPLKTSIGIRVAMGSYKRTEIEGESMYPPCVLAVAELTRLPVDVVYKTYLKMVSRGDNCRKTGSSTSDSSADYATSLRFDVMTGASVDLNFNREDDVINAKMLLQELEKSRGPETALSSLAWGGIFEVSGNNEMISSNFETDGDSKRTSPTSQGKVTSLLTTATVTEAATASARMEAVLGGFLSANMSSDVKEPQREGMKETISNVNGSSTSASSKEGVCETQHKSEGDSKARRMLQEKLWALRSENRMLKARQICRHCRQRPVELTLLPCGHFCFCQKCGLSFQTCPVCKRTILADVRTFVT